MAKNQPNPREFELYLVKNCKTNLYWDGKDFTIKDKKKSILCEFRLMHELEWKHKDIECKIILADWRDDNSWAHLVPVKKCIS